MAKSIREKLEEFEQRERIKFMDEEAGGAHHDPVGYTSYLISEKINILAELLEAKIECLQEDLKQ